jgi:magnesium transporter
MLHILPTQGDDKTGEPALVATDALWLDLLNPTSAEVTSVEKTVGATLPTLGALSSHRGRRASQSQRRRNRLCPRR